MRVIKESTARPVIIGEVLFDRFPGGVEVLGGAPFNVAWHLQGFGAAPLLVSRVGNDEHGREVRDAMLSWGFDLSGLVIDRAFPTGIVDISLSGDDHTFDILPDRAYDQISQQQLTEAMRRSVSLIYHGTLIMRTRQMHDLLTGLHQETDAPLFVDLNLRKPWWSGKDLPRLVERATWAKVNDTELEILAQELDCWGEKLAHVARDVRRIVGVDLMIVTRGEYGAMACSSGGGTLSVVPDVTDEIADTVGAGDAFAAVSILGILQEWPLEITMKRAQAFASRIVKQRGATISEREVYDQMRREWGLSS